MAKRAAAAAKKAGTARRGRGGGSRSSGAGDGRATATVNGPSQEDRSFVLAEMLRLENARQKVNQEQGTLLSNFEKKGGNKKAIKQVFGLMKLDKRQAQVDFEALILYAAGIEISVPWRTDPQDVADDEQPAPKTDGDRDLSAARAHTDGYNSGLRGSVPSDNPFSASPGSIEYVSWHDGRDEGQRDRDKRKPEDAARAAAAGEADTSLPERSSQPF